jgi:hypothetical protein
LIDLASTAGNADHLALYFCFEFFGGDIESRTFVKSGEQKFGVFGNLEGNGSLLGLNSNELFFLVDSNDETYVVNMRDL